MHVLRGRLQSLVARLQVVHVVVAHPDREEVEDLNQADDTEAHAQAEDAAQVGCSGGANGGDGDRGLQMAAIITEGWGNLHTQERNPRHDHHPHICRHRLFGHVEVCDEFQVGPVRVPTVERDGGTGGESLSVWQANVSVGQRRKGLQVGATEKLKETAN